MGICGELVGGSLATMLALTECRLGQSRIGAAAVNSPVVDWVFPDELPPVNPSELPEPMAPDETACPADEDLSSSLMVTEQQYDLPKPERKRKKRATKSPPLTSWQVNSNNTLLPTANLAAVRDMLFRKPEHYFDRFASPLHFFRSPHAQLILPPSEDVLASIQPDDLMDDETRMNLDHFASFQGHAKTLPELPVLARCRAYARNYPPAAAKLSLPVWNVTTGEHNPFFDQTIELVKMIRRSVARQTLKSHAGRSRWHDISEKNMYEEYAEQRVQTMTYLSTALWSQHHITPDWKTHVEGVGVWMKERLRPDFT